MQGMSPEEAFKQSSESITGPITKGISKAGILKLYEGLDKAGQDEFKARNKPAPELEAGKGRLRCWLAFRILVTHQWYAHRVRRFAACCPLKRLCHGEMVRLDNWHPFRFLCWVWW